MGCGLRLAAEKTFGLSASLRVPLLFRPFPAEAELFHRTSYAVVYRSVFHWFESPERWPRWRGREESRATEASGAPSPGKAGAQAPTFPAWKRAFDLAVLFLLAPAILVGFAGLWVLVRLLSHGPVLRQRECVGYRGQTFALREFCLERPARLGPPESATPPIPARGDPPAKAGGNVRAAEAILLGAFLQACEVSWVAQLVNVLRGEVSIVGPRPLTASETVLLPPGGEARLNTPPGLTGLAFVSGGGRLTAAETSSLDVYYAEHRSLGLDLKIVLMTFPALLEQLRARASRP